MDRGSGGRFRDTLAGPPSNALRRLKRVEMKRPGADEAIFRYGDPLELFAAVAALLCPLTALAWSRPSPQPGGGTARPRFRALSGFLPRRHPSPRALPRVSPAFLRSRCRPRSVRGSLRESAAK